jgi:hypothetical protein
MTKIAQKKPPFADSAGGFLFQLDSFGERADKVLPS